MSEWHITPDYIIQNWTDELLDLMVCKLNERKQREKDAMEGRPGKVKDSELFAKARNIIEVRQSKN